MQWIVPITAIPGIALIVLSTSSLLISLNKEIPLLNIEKEKYSKIIDMKIIYGFKSIYIRQKHLKL